jgi:hypothetical protein
MMNDLYNETVERRGHIYHYDPDTDTYYRRYQPQSLADKFGWIILIVVMSAVAYYVEFLR